MFTDSKPIVSTSNTNTKAQSSIPGFFIVRPGSNGGAIVPLIPYDELPAHITLAGISRSLELENTIGMTNLGLVRSSGTIYDIVKSGQTKTIQDKVEEKIETKSPTVNVRILSKRPSPPPKPHLGPRKINLPVIPIVANVAPDNSTNTDTDIPLINSGIHAPSSSPFSPTSTSRASTPPSPYSLSNPFSHYAHATPSRQLCRHWLHHGTCKWAPHCRYEHRMPGTVRGLVANGLSAWPAWWVVENDGQVGGEALQSGRQRGVSPGYGCENGSRTQGHAGTAGRLVEGKIGVMGECCSGCGASSGDGRRRGGVMKIMEERGRKEKGRVDRVQRALVEGLKGKKKRVVKMDVAEKERQKQSVTDKVTLEGQKRDLEKIIEKLQIGKGAVQVENAVATEKHRLVEEGRLVDV